MDSFPAMNTGPGLGAAIALLLENSHRETDGQ